jgi:hypothetical protein
MSRLESNFVKVLQAMTREQRILALRRVALDFHKYRELDYHKHGRRWRAKKHQKERGCKNGQDG